MFSSPMVFVLWNYSCLLVSEHFIGLWVEMIVWLINSICNFFKLVSLILKLFLGEKNAKKDNDLSRNNIYIYQLQKLVIVSNKHSPFFSYALVSFYYLSLIPRVFDLKEVCSSKQVLSSFLSKMEERNKRVVKLDDKRFVPKNVTKHYMYHLN